MQLSNAETFPTSCLSQQRMCDAPIVQHQLNRLLKPSNKARVEGTRCTGAGDWLCATPSATLGLKLSDDQLRIAISLHLGAPISLPHKCSCNADVSELATYHLSCRFSAGRHTLHANLNCIIKSAFATIKVPTVLELNGLFRDDGKHLDGMTVTPFHSGRYLVWDVTCIDKLAPSYHLTASSEGPAAASLDEDRKIKKYSKIQASQVFLPIAIETLGGLGTAAIDFVFKAFLSSFAERRAPPF